MAFGDIIVNPAAATTNSGTSLSVNWGTTPTAGHLMLVWAMTGASDVSISNTGYSLLLDVNNTTEADRLKVFGKIATASEDASVTITVGSADEMCLKIQTIEGPWEAIGSIIDLQEAEARQASGTSIVISPAGTTSQNDELAVAALYTRDGSGNGGTCSWATGSFNEQLDTNTSYKSWHAAHKVLTTTGSVSTTPSWSSSAVNIGGMVTLKKQAAGGSATHPGWQSSRGGWW